jgi:hypothetical protein
MGARKKKRTRFEYLGTQYLWYFDEWRVHIASADKKFVVAYFVGDPWGDAPHLEVFGQHFPGVGTDRLRPVRLQVPNFVRQEWQKSLGAFVNALIRWSLRESHRLKEYESAASADHS